MIPEAPADAPLPPGFGLQLDPATRVAGRTLLGGSPRRALRLSDAGARTLAALLSRPVATAAEGRLARRVVSAGAAHPVPSAAARADAAARRVVVVVPARDRLPALDRALATCRGAGGAAAGAPAPDVLVVDDGSLDAAGVAAVAGRHGARVVRRRVPGGPAAARNTALDLLRSEPADGADAAGGRPLDAVAFLDSDVEVPAGWLGGLLPHLADPLVAAAAPRILGASGRASPLDVGAVPATVRPGTAVAYVPTAALVVRWPVLDGFDEALRYGEDVDAVWRLVAAGWEVRYVPEVVVRHAEPTDLAGRVARRYRYGTSAGPLAVRHPRHLAPAVVAPWPVAAALLLAGGRPVAAAGASAVWAGLVVRRYRPVGVPVRFAVGGALRSVGATLGGLGRWAGGAGLPFALAAAVCPGPARGRRARTVVALLAVHPVATWWRSRPLDDALRTVPRAVVEEAAYGGGVWVGTVAARTSGPLLPRIVRPLRRAPGGTPEGS